MDAVCLFRCCFFFFFFRLLHCSLLFLSDLDPSSLYLNLFFKVFFFPKRFNSSEKKVKTITERKHTLTHSEFRFSMRDSPVCLCISFIQFNLTKLYYYDSHSLSHYCYIMWLPILLPLLALDDWMNECDDTMLLNFPNKFLFLSLFLTGMDGCFFAMFCR